MSSVKDYEEIILENNQEIKIDMVKPTDRLKDKKEGKKRKHISFYVDPVDYLTDTDNQKVICVKCTDTFFNIFFNGKLDENDQVMKEIFKSKVYMRYIPDEEIYRCPNNPEHVELPRDPQISKPKEKKIMGAGIENFPEYVSYMNPDIVKADYIGTANTGKKRKPMKSIFYEETEEEKFARYFNRSP
jgi:hypothetical protein